MKMYLTIAVVLLAVVLCQGQDEECTAVGGTCFTTTRCPSGFRSGSTLGGRCRGSGRKCCVPIPTTTTTTTTTPVPITTIPPPCTAKLDLVFIVDTTLSVNFFEVNEEKDFAKKTAETLGIAEGGVHVGYVNYDEVAEINVRLAEKNNLAEFNAAVDAHGRASASAGSSPNAGVQEATNLFTQEGRDVPKIVVLLTDGPSFIPELTLTAVNAAKAKGIKVITMAIKSDSTSTGTKEQDMIDEFRSYATEPAETNFILVESFFDLPSLSMSVASKICKIECFQSGGQCLTVDDNTCPKGWWSAGPPSRQCIGKDKKCCIFNPTKVCVDLGGECFPNNACPAGFQSVSGPSMKCVGKDLKCCKAVTQR